MLRALISAARRWYLRRLIAAGEAHVAACERDIKLNRADLAALRVELAVLESK